MARKTPTFQTRESYLQMVSQALSKNYEACWEAGQGRSHLKECDIEDVATKMEYKVFTSTTVMMMYRKGMMSMVRYGMIACNLIPFLHVFIELLMYLYFSVCSD